AVSPRIIAASGIFGGLPAIGKHRIRVKVGLTVSHVARRKIQNFTALNALQEETEVKSFVAEPIGNAIGKVGMIAAGHGSVFRSNFPIAVDVFKTEITRTRTVGSHLCISRSIIDLFLRLIDTVHHISVVAAYLISDSGNVTLSGSTGAQNGLTLWAKRLNLVLVASKIQVSRPLKFTHKVT